MRNFGRDGGINRRAILSAALTLPLSSCDSGPYGISWNQWSKAVGASMGIGKAPDLAREQVEQIPFATIGYRVGDSQESVLLLAEKSGTSLLWTSKQRLAIVTSNGRISQTSGFRWNLTDTNFIESDLVGMPLLINPPKGTVRRLCDFSDIDKFQIQIESEFDAQNEESITILGSDILTLRVKEHCRCRMLDWDFDNFYWIDRTNGFVWKTAQHVHPNEPPFQITILRPAA